MYIILHIYIYIVRVYTWRAVSKYAKINIVRTQVALKPNSAERFTSTPRSFAIPGILPIPIVRSELARCRAFIVASPPFVLARRRRFFFQSQTFGARTLHAVDTSHNVVQ